MVALLRVAPSACLDSSLSTSVIMMSTADALCAATFTRSCARHGSPRRKTTSKPTWRRGEGSGGAGGRGLNNVVLLRLEGIGGRSRNPCARFLNS